MQYTKSFDLRDDKLTGESGCAIRRLLNSALTAFSPRSKKYHSVATTMNLSGGSSVALTPAVELGATDGRLLLGMKREVMLTPPPRFEEAQKA